MQNHQTPTVYTWRLASSQITQLNSELWVWKKVGIVKTFRCKDIYKNCNNFTRHFQIIVNLPTAMNHVICINRHQQCMNVPEAFILLGYQCLRRAGSTCCSGIRVVSRRACGRSGLILSEPSYHRSITVRLSVYWGTDASTTLRVCQSVHEKLSYCYNQFLSDVMNYMYIQLARTQWQ